MADSGQPETKWTIEASNKLKQLWAEQVSVEVISQTLHRTEAVVRAKAAELQLPQPVNRR